MSVRAESRTFRNKKVGFYSTQPDKLVKIYNQMYESIY